MNLTKKQLITLQIYRRQAHLQDHEYRAILKSSAGVASAKSTAWTQSGYDRAMAAIETVLFDRVSAGAVPDPRAGARPRIRNAQHWRRRNPGPGRINSRHCHKIRLIWSQLCPLLEPTQRNDRYLAGIIAQATGRTEVGQTSLTAPQARQVIEALKDRLTYAIRKTNQEYPDYAHPQP